MSQTYSLVNPYNNEPIGEYEYTSWEQVEQKLALLKSGHQTQRDTAAFERANVLLKLSELLKANSEELAQLITRETGKTISDSRVEMMRAVNATIACSEEARQITGEALDSDAYAAMGKKIGIVCWRPLGTIFCITPFNFPINIAIHKIGPAYAAGNSVLFKPGPQNTATAQRLVELCYEAGMPENVLQFCMPEMKELDRLNGHSDVNAINFTGGTAAANAIAAAAGYKNLICFSGNRRGKDDETGLNNCVKGLKQLMPLAEKHGVILVMELLNSKINHKDYQCDKTAWGVELCKRLGSENFKLLYDIYHMQIDEGDVIHTIKENRKKETIFDHIQQMNRVANIVKKAMIFENSELPALLSSDNPELDDTSSFHDEEYDEPYYNEEEDDFYQE